MAAGGDSLAVAMLMLRKHGRFPGGNIRSAFSEFRRRRTRNACRGPMGGGGHGYILKSTPQRGHRFHH